MHDNRGRELRVGDKVILHGTITQLSATADYCNVSIRSEFGRKPDDAKENISAINTNVLLRANPGDDNSESEPASA